MSYINLFVEQISSNLDSYIGELDRMTRIATLDDTLCDLMTTPADDNKLKNYTAAHYLQNEMLKLMTQQPSIRNITYIGTNGMIYSGTSNDIQNKALFFNITHADPEQALQENLYLSPAHIPTYLLVDFQQNEEPVFTLTRYLRRYDHKMMGAIVLNITCQDLLDTININPSLLKSGARIVITNKDNQIIADTSEHFNHESLSDKTYVNFSLSDKEKQQDMCFTDTSDILTTTVIIDKTQLFSSTYTYNRIAISLVILLIGIIIVFSAYFSYKLVKPLKLLEAAATTCAEGNYSTRIPVTSQDEIGSLCSSFNFMSEQMQDLLERVYHYQLETKQAQLEALQNQISPHFLHNTLEIIRMKALINKDKEVAVMVQTLARLFRITLDRTSNIVRLRDELEHVQTYLSIQNMRFNNRYHFICDVPEEFLDCSIIKLVLQPLVENSIKHGFSNTFAENIIELRVTASENDLIIQVCDNGIGIDADNLSRIQARMEHKEATHNNEIHNSIGIVNISNRIQLEYGAGYYLHMYPNTPQGTVVELRIPQNYSLCESAALQEPINK